MQGDSDSWMSTSKRGTRDLDEDDNGTRAGGSGTVANDNTNSNAVGRKVQYGIIVGTELGGKNLYTLFGLTRIATISV